MRKIMTMSVVIILVSLGSLRAEEPFRAGRLNTLMIPSVEISTPCSDFTVTVVNSGFNPPVGKGISPIRHARLWFENESGYGLGVDTIAPIFCDGKKTDLDDVLVWYAKNWPVDAKVYGSKERVTQLELTGNPKLQADAPTMYNCTGPKGPRIYRKHQHSDGWYYYSWDDEPQPQFKSEKKIVAFQPITKVNTILDTEDNQEKEKFYLKADGTVEKRVEKVESEIERLKADQKKMMAEIAELKAKASGTKLGSTSPVVPGAAFSVNPNFQPATVQAAPVQYMTVCQNGVCRLVPVSSTTSSGLTDGIGTCTCQPGGCGCTESPTVGGAGYYTCPATVGMTCPVSGQTQTLAGISSGTTYSTTYGSAYGTSYGAASGRQGFFQNRPRLFQGRFRGAQGGVSGGSCASCGQ